jgi:hypothetical protein
MEFLTELGPEFGSIGRRKNSKFGPAVLSTLSHSGRHAESWTNFDVSYRLSSQSAIAVAAVGAVPQFAS